MIVRLHRPDFIAFGTKGFSCVSFHTRINENGLPINVNNQITYVIMIVAFSIMTAFHSNKKAIG